MGLSPHAASTLAAEARALAARLERVRPFALTMPRVAAADVPEASAVAIDRYLLAGRRRLRELVRQYLAWLGGRQGAAAAAAEGQRRFAVLKLQFNAVLTQLDIFADALTQRGEHETGVFLAGLDAAAADALALPGRPFAPPVITYLDRGHGAAIRRARTRLPGGGENPVALVRIPRERMVGSGIASSLVHEVGHQGAALLDLVPSLRRELRAQQRGKAGLAGTAWGLWERWISEIAADFWALAKLGITATQGLMGVVSLPRAFVFRIATDDPHPFPWIRVRLSAAAGARLFPDPQWRALAALWESFYPQQGLPAASRRLVTGLLETMPALVELLVSHRPPALGGRALAQAFPLAERQPGRLRALFARYRSSPEELRRAAPTLAFAVLGQARHDGRLGARAEARQVARLLTHWALRQALSPAQARRTAPRALARAA